MRKINMSCKAAMHKKTYDINQVLRKSGIKTLQDVLNTSVLSNDAKVKHIRHRYTCYEKYLKTFYRDDEGISLRKELNTFLNEFVEGKHTIKEFNKFNSGLKLRLEAANDNFVNTKLEEVKLNNPEPIKTKVIKEKAQEEVQYVSAPKIEGLSERELEVLSRISPKALTADMTEEAKIEACKTWIESHRFSWKKQYLHRLRINESKYDLYIISLYLKEHGLNDLSDLDFLTYRQVIERAEKWLYVRFRKDLESYNNFTLVILPAWIAKNKCEYNEKMLKEFESHNLLV